MSRYVQPVALLVAGTGYAALNALGVGWADAVLGGVLGLGLMVIGIPHGALDVWTHERRNPGRNLAYMVAYLLSIAGVFVAWKVFPHAGLLVFLSLSAWHFGQADFERWGIRKGHLAWGGTVLAMVLFWHIDDVSAIVGEMGVSESVRTAMISQSLALKQIATTALISCAIAALRMRNWEWLLAVMSLAVTPWIPLLLAFGLYFIGQHSASGWLHLQNRLAMSHKELWLKAAPFTCGALILIALGIFWMQKPDEFAPHATYGAFFMLLGSISIPHIFESHWFLMTTTKR